MLCKKGNLWHNTGPNDIICVTTNAILNKLGRLVMGAGVALQACYNKPDLPQKLGDWVRDNGNVPCLLRDEKILSFPTKNDWRDNSDLTLIKNSAILSQRISDANPELMFYLPPPGCGNGNLMWDDVLDILGPILNDRFTVVLK